jgi:hypothetical protein
MGGQEVEMRDRPALAAVEPPLPADQEEPAPLPRPKGFVPVIVLSSIQTALLIVSMVLLYLLITAFSQYRQDMRVEVKRMEAINQTLQHDQTEDIIFLKILILNGKVERGLARKIAGSVRRNSMIYKKDPDLVLSLIYNESYFNPNAISRAGAIGLMQIMPFWKDVYVVENLSDIETNVRCGLQILAVYEKMYQGSLETALAAYNRGPSLVDWDLMRNRDPAARTDYSAKIFKTYELLQSLKVSG